MKQPADETSRVTYLISLPASSACPVMGCPRQQTLTRAIRDVIGTLKKSRTAFKSRQLDELRQRLEHVLASEDG